MANRSISVVLATYNRQSVVLGTLQRLYALRVKVPMEIIVVDNASTDRASTGRASTSSASTGNTAEAIRNRFPQTRLIALRKNLGSCAKALGVERATGAYIVFLDDDSYPRSGSLERMIVRFEEDETLGAVGFRVFLPDGREECSAFPNVFVGCGVGFRRAALEEVGGLDRTLFMQAEEYDLSFRLIHAGWKVETFADLRVDHLKTPRARLSGRTVYYDTRNNLLLAARYLPEPYAAIYRHDWSLRYGWLAARAGHRRAYWRAWLAAGVRGARDRRSFASRRLGVDAFEQLFRHEEIGKRFDALCANGVQRVLLADLGKNLFPFVHHARRVGIEPVAIADDRFSVPKRCYRGIPLLSTGDALQRDFDMVVVSNTSPVHAGRTATRLAGVTGVPIQSWFQFSQTEFIGELNETAGAVSASTPSCAWHATSA